MLKRRRFKQTTSLAERLMEDVSHLKEKLARLGAGPEREHIIKRIRQNETATHIDEWLRSPGLQPPTGVEIPKVAQPGETVRRSG
jgi:hypothetical protein